MYPSMLETVSFRRRLCHIKKLALVVTVSPMLRLCHMTCGSVDPSFYCRRQERNRRRRVARREAEA